MVHAGLIGFSSGYRAMEHRDALIMVWADFPYHPFLPEGVIQVDVRGEQIGHRAAVQVGLVGTLKDAVDPNGILSAGRYGIWPRLE